MTTNMNIMRISNASSSVKAANVQKTKEGANDAFGDTLREVQKSSVKEDVSVASEKASKKDAAESGSTRQETDDRMDTADEAVAVSDAKSKPEKASEEEHVTTDDSTDGVTVNEIDAALLRAMQTMPAMQQMPVVTEAGMSDVMDASASDVGTALTEMVADAGEVSAAPAVASEQKRALSLESLLPDAKNKQGKDLLATLAANHAQLTKYMAEADAQGTATTSATTSEEAVLVNAVGAGVAKLVQAGAEEQVPVQAATQTVSAAIEGTLVAVETDVEADLSNGKDASARMTEEDVQQDADVMAENIADESRQTAGASARTNVMPLQSTTRMETQMRVDAVPMTQQQAVVQPPVSNVQPLQETQTAPRADYDIPRQIVDQVRLIQRGQDSTMVIKLNPEHLGELTLRVSVTGNGAVHASFHSDNATVRGIIENTMVQLKQELQAQGLKVENVGVYAGLSDGQLPQSQDQQSLYEQMAQSGSENASGRRDEESSVRVAEGARALDDVASATEETANAALVDGVDYRV